MTEEEHRVPRHDERKCRFCGHVCIVPCDSSQSKTCQFNRPKETVSHPAHYGGKDNPFEVIKVLEAWLTPEQFDGFLIGNVVKYEARHGQKDGIEDMRKAAWYLNYYLQKRGGS